MRPTGTGAVAATPELDALARAGTVFTHAIAPGNWTLPSHLSFFTGVYPWRHRLRTFQSQRAPLPTIAEWLGAQGYSTGMFTEEVHLVAGYGLEAGYTHRYCPIPPMSDRDRTLTNRFFGGSRWLYSRSVRGFMARAPALAPALTGPNFRAEVRFKATVCNDRTVRAFQEWTTGESSPEPFHAFVNFVDPHEPYSPTTPGTNGHRAGERYGRVPRFYLLSVPPLRERAPWGALEGWYRRGIEESDHKLGGLLAALRARGALDRTWVIVTSDHGQSFGEGGNVYHGCGATDSVLRVPLIVRPPAGISVPARCDRWMSLCDLPSWMKAIALGRSPYDETGHALLPFSSEPVPNDPVYAEGGPASDPNLSLLGVGASQRWNHRLVAAYTADKKYIYDTVAGDLRVWEGVEDPDHVAPQKVAAAEKDAILLRVFGPSGMPEVHGPPGAPEPEMDRTPLKDARMRSWGYD